LDSATALAVAADRGFSCHALTFSYGQRHDAELLAAERVASALGASVHRTVELDLSALGGSALTDPALEVPRAGDTGPDEGIPVTYVPARNTVFLSYALAYAEVVGARDLFIGVSSVDYSGYPDCRPEFVEAFERLANVGTRAGVEGDGFTVHAPLLHLSKADTVLLGASLGVDYGLTHSCYDPEPDGAACRGCDACRLRRRGFVEAGLPDPTRYAMEEPS